MAPVSHRRLVILLLLAALLAALAASDPVYAAADRVLAWSRPIMLDHAVLGVLLFALLSALSALVVFFSTIAIVPLAVDAWGKPTTLVLLWGSWLAGAAVSYWVGRHPGRRLANWAGSQHHLAMYEERLSTRASFPLVVLFQVAVPSEIPGLVLGAIRYDFRRYLGARAIAEIPFALGSVYLGDAFLRRELVLLLVIAVVGALLAFGALHLLHRRIGG